MIRAHVEAANCSNDAAYVQAAFDGANRDEYFYGEGLNLLNQKDCLETAGWESMRVLR